jgi:hypothetical protein
VAPTAILWAATIMLTVWTTPSMAQTPRTADGRPDLQGVWDFRTMTPLQRPTDLGEQAFLTDEEVAAQEAGVAERRARLLNILTGARVAEAEGRAGTATR